MASLILVRLCSKFPRVHLVAVTFIPTYTYRYIHKQTNNSLTNMAIIANILISCDDFCSVLIHQIWNCICNNEASAEVTSRGQREGFFFINLNQIKLISQLIWFDGSNVYIKYLDMCILMHFDWGIYILKGFSNEQRTIVIVYIATVSTFIKMF